MRLPGTAFIAYARHWYTAGYTPLPLYYASKRPTIYWKAWSQQRPDWSEIVAAFATPLYRGMALLMGGDSGLTVLDFDSILAYVHWKAITDIESFTVRTGRGFHIYFHLDDPPLATLSMRGGEVKGSGYVVAPPSTHPSGREYEAVDNGVEWPVRMRNLHSLGVTLTMPDKPKRKPTVRDVTHGNSIIDQIKAALPLTRFLSPHTELEPSGQDFLMGVCPFHNDHSPSLWVNERLEICGCFAPHCPAHDRPLDVINAYSLLTGIHNGEAIADLAQQLGL